MLNMEKNMTFSVKEFAGVGLALLLYFSRYAAPAA